MQLNRFILLCLLLSGICSTAQIPWRIDHLSIEQGLSEGYVYAIHEDEKGFIWIGTHGGLNRYDGYGFKIFQYKPFDSTSLGDNSVFFIKEDSSTGHFWIGGSSCLNEFDPITFRNKRYRFLNEQLEFGDGVFINKDELLLACQSRVLIFNTATKTFSNIPVFDENNQAANLSRVENISSDSKGNIMVMSRTGIFFYDSKNKICKRKTSTSPDFSAFYHYEVFNVLLDKSGNYWIATNKKGLIKFDPVNNRITTINPPAPLKNENLRFDIVMQDSFGAIWAGSSNGLFKINPISLELGYFSSNTKQKIALSHPEINAITEDRNHFMWIGTVGGGINKMIPQNAGFKNLKLAEGNNTGTYVMAMQQINQDIWFINIWDQIGKVNITSGEITLLKKPFLPSSYSWYSEGAIVTNQQGRPLVLNGENSFEVNDKKPLIVNVNSSPGLYHIHYAKNGETYYLVKAAVKKTYYHNDTIYGNQFFYDSEEDASGNIWIGTSRGLLQFNTSNKQLKEFVHDDRDPGSISSDFIYALELDNSNQTIWMAAYNGGLCSYNIPSGKFRHFSKEDGLADNIVYSIEKDQHDNLWFSTNAGISTYQTKQNIFKNYGLSDGLLNSEFNRQSSCSNADGWIFFGGIFGIDYFHPDSILKTKSNPSLAFTNFKVFNKDYPGAYEDKRPHIELNHNDRYITIEFAALDYKDQQKIQYAYRLNKNTDWVKLGDQHILSFSDLGTGLHHLEIRSTNAEGVWLDNEIAMEIYIKPAWWQTGWFRILSIMALLSLAIIIVRSYYGRKLRRQKQAFEKQQAVERERTRIATDMHDDLGAGLTRIKFITENMLGQAAHTDMKADVQKLKSSSNELVEKMGEIIWAMNEKNNSLEDLLFYLRSYAVDYCSENNLSCEFSLPSSIPVVIIDGQTRRNIFLILKESLHNIVKHAAASHVTISVEVDKRLWLLISDNGRGFSQVATANGNGLLSMQRRATDMGGKLFVEQDGSVQIKLEIPLA